MSLAVLARKSKATNPRYNKNKGCFVLNVNRKGKLSKCLTRVYRKGSNCNDCKSCDILYIPSKPSKQSSYHNYQRKLRMQYNKNCDCCIMGNISKGKINNTVQSNISRKNGILEEKYENSSDVILKRKNEALKSFNNPNTLDSSLFKVNNDGKYLYNKSKPCDPCCFSENRIKSRIYSNSISLVKNNNDVMKSLTEVKNLKNSHSNYLSRLKATALNDYKKGYLCNGITTYDVTVTSGNFYINGQLKPTLTLTEGCTYRFNQTDTTNGTHPLRFSTTENGIHTVGGTEYTTGVTKSNINPGSSGSYIQITVAVGAPTLYYYCAAHPGMGGQINTV